MSLSYDAIKQLWIQAGGPAGAADTAAAITMPESSANPAAVQQGQPYATTGWGLWQITPGNSEPSIGINQALLDPLTNARAAVAKFRAAGNSFSPWTTYEDGKYRQYLQGADWAGGGTGATTTAALTSGGTTNVHAVGFLDWFTKFGSFLLDPVGGLGNLLSGGSSSGAGGILGAIPGVGDIVKLISALVNDVNEAFKLFAMLFNPAFWLRVGAFFMGCILLVGGSIALIGAVKE